jgi:anhydro-N-acetylmuramic acid kinase
MMSGTSLDGLDIAHCTFTIQDENISYHLNKAETIAYTEIWENALRNAHHYEAASLLIFDRELGQFMGSCVQSFLNRHNLSADFISSHGHTIFHQPSKKLTFQAGHGAGIASVCKLPVVCDFRSLDVLLGGQGAPLVPIGDHYLFSQFDYCINLGGIANTSFIYENNRIAFDICPFNQLLNYVAQKAGKDYDEGGRLAASGSISDNLLASLNLFNYYDLSFPKSLGREDLERYFIPLLEESKLSIADLSATLSYHIAMQIAKSIDRKNASVLLTGGGVYHDHIIYLLKKLSPANFIIPDDATIQFKEAIIFGLLGLLRWTNKTNTLKYVTGANVSSCGGAIYFM